MKKLLILLLIALSVQSNTNGQTSRCDLPDVIGIRELPLFHGTLSSLEPMRKDLIYQTVEFKFPDWANLFVDFDDGEGRVEVATGETVVINYPTTGGKHILYDQPGVDGVEPDLLEHSFKIRINPTTGTYELPDERWTIGTDATYSSPMSDLFPSDSPFSSNEIESALISIKYAEGNTELTRPFVLCLQRFMRQQCERYEGRGGKNGWGNLCLFEWTFIFMRLP